MRVWPRGPGACVPRPPSKTPWRAKSEGGAAPPAANKQRGSSGVNTAEGDNGGRRAPAGGEGFRLRLPDARVFVFNYVEGRRKQALRDGRASSAERQTRGPLAAFVASLALSLDPQKSRRQCGPVIAHSRARERCGGRQKTGDRFSQNNAFAARAASKARVNVVANPGRGRRRRLSLKKKNTSAFRTTLHGRQVSTSSCSEFSVKPHRLGQS